MSLDLTGEAFRDDRILCTSCRELVLRYADTVTVDGVFARARPGDCLAAIERRRLDVHDRYGPAELDLPRRCEFFLAKRDAEDRRTGAERFPTLMAEYQAKQAGRNQFHRAAAQRGIERAKAAIEPHGERVA